MLGVKLVRRNRFVFAVAALIVTGASLGEQQHESRLCGGLILSASRRIGSAASTGIPSKDSDATVDVFLTLLKRRDFAEAASHFDATVEAAVPKERLASVWDSFTAKLGPLDSWTIVQRDNGNTKDAREALLEFQHGELRMSISISPQTEKIISLFFKPVPPAATAAPYAIASSFRTEDISVGREPFALKGTLTTPAGKGPFPGVVLVHGSGPNDRDESIGSNKPFKDIAEGLASRGIVVLRYDKRTFQYGFKLSSNISIDDEVIIDAVAAIQLLKSRPEVDLHRVFVLGHSLGALLAPEIGVRAGGMAGAVLLAPPGRAPWELLVAQLRYLHAPADQLAEAETAAAFLQKGELGERKLLGAPASYWQDLASRDGVAMAKKLHSPILILRGDRDYQVTEVDMATWMTGLRGVANVEMTTLQGDNHLFIRGTGKPGPAEYGIPGHVDARVIAMLASFFSRG